MRSPRDQTIAPGRAGPNRVGVAVFGRNEAPSIERCVAALAATDTPHALDVAIILNGSTDGSADIAVTACRHHALACRVVTIRHADKANAINQYLHALRPDAGAYVFVDAYAAVAPDAIARLTHALATHPHANAAAAVPSTGRSAAALRATMLAQPSMHGSLFALTSDFVARIAARGLRLPVGLYRGDGLLGSFALHDLDAATTAWDTRRIVVVPEATWTTRPLKPWLGSDLGRHVRRLIRQGRGRLENAAIKRLIYPGGFEALPGDANRMLIDVTAAHPAMMPRWWRDPAAWIALRDATRAPPIDPAALQPLIVARFGAADGSGDAVSGDRSRPRSTS